MGAKLKVQVLERWSTTREIEASYSCHEETECQAKLVHAGNAERSLRGTPQAARCIEF